MNTIGQRILNETNLLVNDKPHFFKQLLANPGELLAWQDVENCMNNPYLYDFEMIDSNGLKVDIPRSTKAWMYGKTAQNKKFLFEKFHQGNSLIIMNYGFYNEKTNHLLDIFERMFDVNSAIHVYCGLTDSKSFTIHDDYPCNFIIQVEGTTRWKVYNNRISYMYKVGTMNNQLNDTELDVAIDVELSPGDALYIPSRMYHCAYPTGKRLSMSIPCWNRFPTDPEENRIDRNMYRINPNV